MGYTHYWHVKPEGLTEDRRFGFLGLALEFRLEAERLEIETEWDYAHGELWGPLEASHVVLNGVEPNDYENFVWPPLLTPWQEAKEDGTLFDFCKTGRRPYDAVVCALLIAIKSIYGDDVEIDSDGEWDEAAWQAGADFYESAIGEPAKNPLN